MIPVSSICRLLKANNRQTNEQALNPDPDDPPNLDPEDAALLLDPSSSPSTPYTNGSQSNPSTPLPTHVPWLRKTEYISREVVQRSSPAQEPRYFHTQAIDVSPAAQLQTIEASFAACNSSATSNDIDLSALKHPNKPHVTAVESYEVFPDAEIWANAYDLFRFSERPGERAVDVRAPLSTLSHTHAHL
jgi:RNA polymerase II-associated factor 1